MSAASLLFAIGAAVLAASPIRWLFHTWTDPAYDSPGPWVFALVLALAAWSWTSARVEPTPAAAGRARGLLAGTALLRLVSHLLDVDVLGGFALVADVYALAILGGLPSRRRALSASWLAIVFAFCLPIERVLQRLVGYGLQWASAAAAARLLALVVPDLEWAGISIRVGGRSVLVDVPCSGARGLVSLGLLFAASCALRRPTWVETAVGLLAAIGGAAAANVLRVAVLALGVAYPDAVGIDVMGAPWHEAIGAAALAIGSLPIVLWARWSPSEIPLPPGEVKVRGLNPLRRIRDPIKEVEALFESPHLTSPGGRGTPRGAPKGNPVFAWAFLALALSLFFLPHHPVDASAPVEPLALPANLLGHAREIVPLDEKEQIYFTRYGGRAVKARYGPFAVLAVTTTAPLRHLHAPDECLRGSGHAVRLIRTAYDGPLPSALYASRTPDGAALRVAATFFSDRGDLATSVSEVAWRWMNAPAAVWTSLERISPADLPAADAAELDAALAAALEVPRPPAAIRNPTSSIDEKRRTEA